MNVAIETKTLQSVMVHETSQTLVMHIESIAYINWLTTHTKVIYFASLNIVLF